MYSKTPLVRPPLLHKKSGLLKELPLVRGRNQYIYIVKWPLQRGWPLVRVASQKDLHCTPFLDLPCRVGSVGSMSASRTVGREFASRPGHTKDHHKNGTNCLPA